MYDADEAALLEEYKEQCIRYIVGEVVKGQVSVEEVAGELEKAVLEERVMPEVVRMERFLECVMRGEAMTGRAGVLSTMLERRLERMKEPYLTSTSDASDTPCAWSSDSDAPPNPVFTLHLNPHLPLTEAEYTTWMSLCRQLRDSNTLTCGESPRKLLMLMSPACTAGTVVEAMEALIRLYNYFKDDWFAHKDFKVLKRIIKRAMGVLEVHSPTPSTRRARLKQRRKVFKAKKRIWEDERVGRDELEEQFGEMLTAYKMQQLHPSFTDLPNWFTALLQEHHASLEEQYARTLLEAEYADVLNQLHMLHPTVVT